MKTHRYMGHNIYPCERVKGEHRGKWIVQRYHKPSGMPFTDELCPHFASLAELRAWIRCEVM